MLLEFPTGSNTTGTGYKETIGALQFMNDGSWNFKSAPAASKDELEIIQEFIDFISFAIIRQDFIEEFLKFKSKIEDEDYDAWRRQNFKLIKGDLISD